MGVTADDNDRRVCGSNSYSAFNRVRIGTVAHLVEDVEREDLVLVLVYEDKLGILSDLLEHL